MITAVFDCMVFLQAATNDNGPAFACLELVEAGAVGLSISADILAEVGDVLTRPEIRARFPNLTGERVDLLLQRVATLATVAADAPDAGYPLRDPDDSPYFNLAVAADVGYLVSWDKDLLDLMKDPRFVETFPRLQIVNPVVFLNIARAT